MNDINATIGLHNLPHMRGLLEKNRNNNDYLYTNLLGCKGVTLLENSNDRKSACWLFTMKVDKKTDFVERMKFHGIMTSQVHNRNDLNTCVSEFQCDLPNITELEQSLVCIPVGWWLEKEQLDYIIDKIKDGW
jgi:dTDP-4-amino-4,6-dideoxygalactose transaminase